MACGLCADWRTIHAPKTSGAKCLRWWTHVHNTHPRPGASVGPACWGSDARMDWASWKAGRKMTKNTAEERAYNERTEARLRRIMGLIEKDGRGVARVAAAIGLSEGQLRRRMRDLSKIGVAELVMLCEALGVDAASVLSEPPTWEDDWFPEDGLRQRVRRFGSVLVSEGRAVSSDGQIGFGVLISIDDNQLANPRTTVVDAESLAGDLSNAAAFARRAIAAATLDEGLTLDPSI